MNILNDYMEYALSGLLIVMIVVLSIPILVIMAPFALLGWVANKAMEGLWR